MHRIRALAFDVFGTIVDWRTGIAREASGFFAALDRTDIDPWIFADAWRALYQPAMEECRSGRRPYVRLDVLNHETVEALLLRHGVDIGAIGQEQITEFAHAWRRLDPWPDVNSGLARLKKRYPLVTLSNGNVALMVEMSRRSGLPWDAILGAEATQTYKPLPQAYLGTVEILDLDPAELCLVAAHHSDLAAARACGLVTAYVARPDEYGGRLAPDSGARQAWEFDVDSLDALADELGC